MIRQGLTGAATGFYKLHSGVFLGGPWGLENKVLMTVNLFKYDIGNDIILFEIM